MGERSKCFVPTLKNIVSLQAPASELRAEFYWCADITPFLSNERGPVLNEIRVCVCVIFLFVYLLYFCCFCLFVCLLPYKFLCSFKTLITNVF